MIYPSKGNNPKHKEAVKMTKNEFMVCMHDLIEKERFILKLQSDGKISGIASRTVISELVEEATKIRTSYFSDDNPNREVLSKEEMIYVCGRI